MKPGNWDRVNELFHAAINLTDRERAALVDRARAEDSEVGRELQELLAADARAGSCAIDRSADISETATEVFRVDQRVGIYRIVREIGRGGMGIVYLADDLQLRGPVALKVLSPSLAANANQRERLRREAEAARRLSHPAVATVYAFHDFDGIPCIAYEFVAGRTLRDQLRDGPLPIAEVAAIGIEIADALGAAQAKGITHRDLKPENVMCTSDGRIKVLDFGLALLDSGDRSADPKGRLTRDNVIVGTPSYMAPEQLRCLPVDHRTDIFQLGTLLYELAAGRHPFETSDPTLTMARILVSEPRQQALPSIDLDRIVRKCLQKSPDDRYQSAADLRTDLERVRAGARQRDEVGRPVIEIASGKRQIWRAPWRIHQLVLSVAYIAMVGAAGVAMRTGILDSDAVFAVIACGATVGIIARLHLVFHERLDPQSTADRLRRLMPVLQVCDAFLTLALLAASVMLLATHRVVAAAVLAAAIALGFTFAVIEPATTKRAFRRRKTPSGLRRKAVARIR